MAHTKAAGSTHLGRESESKRLGVKLFEGQKANPGNIIIRQRGTKYLPGKNVKLGKDDSIYALKAGVVKFQQKKIRIFNGLKAKYKIMIHVI